MVIDAKKASRSTEDEKAVDNIIKTILYVVFPIQASMYACHRNFRGRYSWFCSNIHLKINPHTHPQSNIHTHTRARTNPLSPRNNVYMTRRELQPAAESHFQAVLDTPILIDIDWDSFHQSSKRLLALETLSFDDGS